MNAGYYATMPYDMGKADINVQENGSVDFKLIGVIAGGIILGLIIGIILGRRVVKKKQI